MENHAFHSFIQHEKSLTRVLVRTEPRPGPGELLGRTVGADPAATPGAASSNPNTSQHLADI